MDRKPYKADIMYFKENYGNNEKEKQYIRLEQRQGAECSPKEKGGSIWQWILRAVKQRII